MIQLLFTVLVAEAGVAAALLFKTPLRKLAVLALDRLKRGRGPVMVRTVAATVLVVLASSLHSMAKIHGHAGGGELDAPGALTPTDQVLLARHLLEASLMAFHVLCLIPLELCMLVPAKKSPSIFESACPRQLFRTSIHGVLSWVTQFLILALTCHKMFSLPMYGD